MKLLATAVIMFAAGAAAMELYTRVSFELMMRGHMENLTSEDREARVRAAKSLMDLGKQGERAIEQLGNALSDEFVLVRVNAAFALGNMGSAAVRAIPQLRQALKADPEDSVRMGASYTLSRLGKAAQPATPELIGALQDPSPTVRVNAVRTLGEIGNQPGVVNGLIHSLGDQAPEVRRAATNALVKIGTPEGLAAIENYASSL